MSSMWTLKQHYIVSGHLFHMNTETTLLYIVSGHLFHMNTETTLHCKWTSLSHEH
jgi:hypothetical protein